MKKDTAEKNTDQAKKPYGSKKWIRESKEISARLQKAPDTVRIHDALRQREIPWLRTKRDIPRLLKGSVFDDKGHPYLIFITDYETYQTVEAATGKTHRSIRREFDRTIRAGIYKDLGFIGLPGGGKAKAVAVGYWLEGHGYPKKVRFLKNEKAVIAAFSSEKTVSKRPKARRTKSTPAADRIFFEYFEKGSKERDSIFSDYYKRFLKAYAPTASENISLDDPNAQMALHRARVKADRIEADYQGYMESVFDHFSETQKGDGFPMPGDMDGNWAAIHNKWIEDSKGYVMASPLYLHKSNDPDLKVWSYMGTDRQVRYFGRVFDYCKRLAGTAPVKSYLARFVEKMLIPLAFAESKHTGFTGDDSFIFDNWSAISRKEFEDPKESVSDETK